MRLFASVSMVERTRGSIRNRIVIESTSEVERTRGNWIIAESVSELDRRRDVTGNMVRFKLANVRIWLAQARQSSPQGKLFSV